jgi:predicted RNA-binding Zn ribbon-like protein
MTSGRPGGQVVTSLPRPGSDAGSRLGGLADTETSLRAAVALVNSAGRPDSMTTVADLDAFFTEHGYTGLHRRTRSELAEVRAIREPVAQLLMSTGEQAADLINSVLRQARAVPQLVRHGHFDWHIHAISPDSPLATRILVETAMAALDVLRSGENERLSTCEAPKCRQLVLDLTRNRSRRFCSTTCQNRVAVAHLRARRRSMRGHSSSLERLEAGQQEPVERRGSRGPVVSVSSGT